MKVTIQGEVFKSLAVEGKDMFKTAITQDERDLQTVTISTRKQYKPGDKIKIQARVNVSMYRDKAYMIVIEDTLETEEKKPDLNVKK